MTWIEGVTIIGVVWGFAGIFWAIVHGWTHDQVTRVSTMPMQCVAHWTMTKNTDGYELSDTAKDIVLSALISAVENWDEFSQHYIDVTGSEKEALREDAKAIIAILET